ncbi:MAG: hypothetical protein IJ970_00690, partial [Mycoplasmataceae bacterium]|nr:hypothetical protein [Mycoplasmataceae bacterium]
APLPVPVRISPSSGRTVPGTSVPPPARPCWTVWRSTSPWSRLSWIPQEYLIIDKEYNSILKFHENDLWKKIKPFAIDWNGNVYYVCNIDIDMINWINEQQKNNNNT